MKNRLKMLVAALGVTALVVSQNGVIQANAEEAPTATSSVMQSPTNLTWNEKGQGIFYNPNAEAYLIAEIFYGEDEYVGYYDGGMYQQGDVTFDIYHVIESYGKSGTYTYGVKAVYNNGADQAFSNLSKEFSYTRPSAQLPNPNVTVSESGVVTCELSGAEGYTLGNDYGFNYMVYEDGKQVLQWGNDYAEINLGAEMPLKEGHSYIIRVQTLSRNINKYLSSGWSECTLNLRSDNSSAAVVTEQTSSPSNVSKRRAAYSKEKVVFTADSGNSYTIKINNAMQGEKCFDSFEAAAGDWNIGRTYNILPYGRFTYKMNEKARITLRIPKSLQAEGRAFKMISVTQDGEVAILDDLDSDPNAITFETDTYYAFALVYMDTVVSK